MKRLVLLGVLAAAYGVACSTAAGTTTDGPRPGTWRAALRIDEEREVPFLIDLALGVDGGLEASLLNGDERIGVRARIDGSRVRLDLDPYDSWIEADLDDDGEVLTGTWVRPRGRRATTRMAFRAVHGVTSRWPATRAAGPEDARIDGRWSVRFSADRDPSVAVFTSTPGGALRGTFLTTLGDYRFLAGTWDGSDLRLSCFDGAHAFLFEAQLADDGTLRGSFHSRDTYTDTWTAERDPDAALPDPFELTGVDPNAPWGELAFPDLEGVSRRLDDPAFHGAVRVLTLFGTWCPNCTDHARFLKELEERWSERGVSFLGLAFEYDDELAAQTARVRAWKERLEVTHPVLVGGSADKQRAHAAFPVLSAVRAYPTTIFIDREGRIDSVHTGFSGPATGEAHERLRDSFTGTLHRLLGPEAEAPRKE